MKTTKELGMGKLPQLLCFCLPPFENTLWISLKTLRIFKLVLFTVVLQKSTASLGIRVYSSGIGFNSISCSFGSASCSLSSINCFLN